MAKILVTGGAGYIGSHTIVDLLENGHDALCVDSLLNSDPSAMRGVQKITGRAVKNAAFDLADLKKTRAFFEKNAGQIDGVIHFAAVKAVGESVEKPLFYYQNNLVSLLNLVACMKEFGVKNLIFSSSCSVYGNTTELPVTEKTPLQPAESPYAATKQMGERILEDICRAEKGLNVVLLRYFNPAGAHMSGKLGEAPSNPALALVPVITETAIGRRKELVVYGDDYETRDGSCVRDFIHVMDLAHAHTLAVDYLLQQKNPTNCEVFNLGIGDGVSVLEAIRAFEKVNKMKFNWRIGPRRAGDVVSIFADYSKAKKELGWSPKFGLDAIMSSAWQWEKKRSKTAAAK